MSRLLDVLMFKPAADDGPPAFIVVSEPSVKSFEAWGWFLLVTEREVRYADLEDVRREDERGQR